MHTHRHLERVRVRSGGQTARFTYGDWLQRTSSTGGAFITLVEEGLLHNAAAAAEAKAAADAAAAAAAASAAQARDETAAMAHEKAAAGPAGGAAEEQLPIEDTCAQEENRGDVVSAKGSGALLWDSGAAQKAQPSLGSCMVNFKRPMNIRCMSFDSHPILGVWSPCR
jgi:hypothetical protein